MQNPFSFYKRGIVTRTLALCNLGCSKNIVDGETMLQWLSDAGFTLVDDYETASVIVVNTCAFIKEATQEAVTTILEFAECKKKGTCSTLVVAGCFAKRYKESAEFSLPEVDVWTGVDTWREELSEYFKVSAQPTFKRVLTEPHATQYLKIAEGCSHGCTFCAIPGIKGGYKSRPLGDIITEAKWLASVGVQECILVAQDTSYYGRDCGTSLVNLLKALLKETTFPWIRMMYLHPRFVDDELLDLIAAEPRMCRYFDIPLQHSSQPILDAMKRGHAKETISILVNAIRSRMSDAVIRTSFIVGFPGETADQFDELLECIQVCRFDKVGVFPFSPEEGTIANSFKKRPRTQTVMHRSETLMEIQREISSDIQTLKIGSILDVILDGVNDNPDYSYSGRTRGDAPEVDGNVHILSGDAEVGAIVSVRIVATDDYDLFGEIVPRS